MVPWERAGGAAQAPLALQSFETSGNNLLGYVAGLGVILGVLALIIIGGRMIHANFTGDPWIAARGMAELPYVVLAVVLIAGSGSLTAMLFEGSLHHPEEDVSTSIRALVEEQAANEREAADCAGALQSGNGSYLCPDDDGWEELAHTVPIGSDTDPRCTRDGAEDCYEYCFDPSFGEFANAFRASPCTPDNDHFDLMESADWSFARYHCPNLPASWWDRSEACEDNPVENAGGVPDHYPADLPEAKMQRYYACTEYPGWVRGNQREEKVGENFCPRR
ncbi:MULTISPECIES: TrbC/VirB2 family protein [Nocardiopsis]|uniref:Uncharacterized protein n=1 Tax=Nocardiopsis dassonvillei (strain ATCC 23218 / DSM 43111 / CIP 107115 / JCM 7437 / KCTC 9190 / NBRC 14626 / NCTC 10488 / NRRL B-5397 / IMRU 509) TaxID=446468 RepID=D7B9P6_NOCDD|nr:TrbC/VirB2 family protein [Nocardiopsis dassonvillei]ADH70904.1 hypothetical protein Ndas_5525 [Nocardiopsis dassonvillei subsp. dassonvillei DSM 43111]APC33504.1 hypothetical protein A9R04_01750 [Nocardiopsis dassonvillei]NKY81737.1 TrbC/VirB2 family protein [Nocardiopsis dassonvillei]VEI91113.1 Uncharacterised protein [Nocardiopsis dassonvillei]